MVSLEEFGSKRSLPNRGSIPEFFGGTEETHQYLSYDNWCPGRDSNRAPHEYKSRALPLDQSAWSLRPEIRIQTVSFRHTQTEVYC
jgi:hypothetical protein